MHAMGESVPMVHGHWHVFLLGLTGLYIYVLARSDNGSWEAQASASWSAWPVLLLGTSALLRFFMLCRSFFGR